MISSISAEKINYQFLFFIYEFYHLAVIVKIFIKNPMQTTRSNMKLLSTQQSTHFHK